MLVLWLMLAVEGVVLILNGLAIASGDAIWLNYLASLGLLGAIAWTSYVLWINRDSSVEVEETEDELQPS